MNVPLIGLVNSRLGHYLFFVEKSSALGMSFEAPSHVKALTTTRRGVFEEILFKEQHVIAARGSCEHENKEILRSNITARCGEHALRAFV